jgi:threonine/homoserine/homoserine lactone efflux protein
LEAIVAIVLLVGVGAITPGPNNVIVMAESARGGFRAALPPISGVIVGALAMLATVWFGAHALLDRFSLFRLIVTSAGSAYLAWMGVRMIWLSTKNAARSPDSLSHSKLSTATLFGMAAFQFANPKAWTLLLAVTALAATDLHGAVGFVTLATIFSVISAICLCIWAIAGTALSRTFAGTTAIPLIEQLLGFTLIILALVLAVGVMNIG